MRFGRVLSPTLALFQPDRERGGGLERVTLCYGFGEESAILKRYVTGPDHRNMDFSQSLGRMAAAAALFVAAGIAVAGGVAGFAAPAGAEPRHAIAMHGDPKYPADFSHFPYADPAAPKGGRLVRGQLGTFDSLNPFIIKGTAASGLRDGTLGNNVYESLLERSYDEAFALYGLLAETVETPPDRSFVEFTLRPQARFSDGVAVKPADVVFSWQLLRDKGRPNVRQAYAKVERVEMVGERGVRFVFKSASDRELPLILGLMPILPAHAMTAEAFDKTSLTPPIGSGPYVVAAVEPGTRITYRRNPDYWGKDLPLKRGFDNFDEIRYDYYRDATTLFESFKTGAIDVIGESDPGRWSSGYDFPAVADGRVVKDVIASGLPRPFEGLVFNTRRAVFADIRVREALTRLFDFEFINPTLYYGLRKRTQSYFEGSELASTGRPASARERALLAPFPGAVRADVMEGTFALPRTDGSGRDRAQLRAALDLLKAAGYRLDGGQLKGAGGQPLAFELLIGTRDEEKVALAYQRTLQALGIAVAIRTVDAVQFQQRRQTYDYDMTTVIWAASLSPGNEQNFRWSAAAARADGSFNYAGVADPAVDAMIAALLAAEGREAFVDAARALDRVLVSGFYTVPLSHTPDQWYARWTRVGRPERPALWGAVPSTWFARP